MKLRKLFAGVAAAATLFGGLALGASTATAAEADISGTTITVTASDANQFYTKPFDAANPQNNLREFKYVELAKYVSDGNSGVELQGLVDGAEGVDAAFTAAGYSDATKGDYLTKWDWLGNTTLTAAQTTGFVNELKGLATADTTPTASADGKTQTFTFGEGGLYLIVDQSGQVIVEENENHKLVWDGNAPILAGTAIANADPAVGNAEGTILAGVVDLKSNHEDTQKADPVVFTKTDKTRTNGLDGAVFNVYEVVDGKASDAPVAFVKTGDGVYRLPNTNETGTTVTDLTTANAKGKFQLLGLKRGATYKVAEKTAPKGYNGNFKGEFTFTVDKDGHVTGFTADALKLAAQDAKTGAITVVNVKNIIELPKTGAAGIALFVALAALLGGAAATVFAKSRSVKRSINA
ncbi:SpaA isopeptide-forming pilin-related protein [Bifidobacterium platyrrhinorum]|uniref:LPXTG cell wall anchor domain-containing protein n=1 Tax=Bifidobacterium platyrrhinorum TaxID=2661628 RepID=A0A6L9SR27_9BIFI|nr:SpaA isopeptide-forming pilin-related protein [Bifidobacterium platyrrhinorum]NEG54944.1 LPXTG cell wall anchor domain-containing protein [Bifidobacterium platyrrhinorum]